MSWLLAYLLLSIIIILMFWVGFKKDATWKSRLKGWGLLLLPVAIYMWDYPVVYYQHVRDCKSEGGLRIFIQPVKAEHVQFNTGPYDESTAHSKLHKFYPHLKLVETTGNTRDKAKNPNGYFSYSLSYSGGASDRSANWQEDWKFNKTPLLSPSKGVYVISQHKEDSQSGNRRTKYEWTLTRNDQLYAKVTNYIHRWTGVRYPDAVPFWSCWDRYSEEYAYPEEDLIKLILK